MTDIQVRFQSVMQVRRCNTFFHRTRSSVHGEDLWIALAEAENELGLKNEKGESCRDRQEQIDELKAHADDINYDVAKEREKLVRHDVMSHVYAYGQQCPKAAGIIHLGCYLMLCGG